MVSQETILCRLDFDGLIESILQTILAHFVSKIEFYESIRLCITSSMIQSSGNGFEIHSDKR
jgi:hypothetical protein